MTTRETTARWPIPNPPMPTALLADHTCPTCLHAEIARLRRRLAAVGADEETTV